MNSVELTKARQGATLMPIETLFSLWKNVKHNLQDNVYDKFDVMTIKEKIN